MKRGVALRSYFLKRNLSPARIDVALMGRQIELSGQMNNASGIILYFAYDQDPKFRQSEIFNESGPQISLGAYPSSFSPAGDEGIVIEFSVLETRLGVPSWKFQILKTETRDTASLVQEISGNEPVMHQIYWNGKKDFFGEAMEPGKYLIVLTASDVNGRQSMAKKFVTLLSKAGEKTAVTDEIPRKEPVVAAKSGASPASGIKSKVLPLKTAFKAVSLKNRLPKKTFIAPKVGKRGKVSQKKNTKKSVLSRTKKPAKKTAVVKPAIPDNGNENDGDDVPNKFISGQVTYKVAFYTGTDTLTPEGDDQLKRFKNHANMYSGIAKLIIKGCAGQNEIDPPAMAQKRADIVAALLTNTYGIKRDQMSVDTKISETPNSSVEIRWTKAK